MNWADWSIVFIIVLSGLIGMKRGFIKEALSLTVWVVAFLAARWLDEPLANVFTHWLDNVAVSMRQSLAFILVFFLVLILGGVINYLLGTLVEMIGLKMTDRLFGVLFGLARGALVVMVAVLYIPEVVPVHRDAWWYNSAIIPYFSSMENTFFIMVSAVHDIIKRLL